MSCDQARSRLSDFLEDSLAPAPRQELLKHVSACAACKAELLDLQAALRALRSSPREEPPPELLAAILAKVESLPAGSPRARAPMLLAPGKQRLLWLSAALLLFASLLALESWSQSSAQGSARKKIEELEARLEKHGSETSRLAAELARKVETWALEKKELLEGMDGAKRKLQAVEESETKALLARESERRQLGSEIGHLEGRVSRQAEEIRILEGKLSSSREEAAKRTLEVARLERELSQGGSMSSPGDEGREMPHLVFRRRGGHLEIKTDGPLEVVVSELFQAARDESDPELAGLALGALEDLLVERDAGRAVPKTRKEDDSPGFLGQWNRGIAALASEAGLGSVDGAAENARQGEASREERLKALEAAWRSKKLGQ
jgi:hypothetical protein